MRDVTIRKMLVVWGVGVALLFGGATLRDAVAQASDAATFTGSYSLKSAEGVTPLTLKQDKDGKVTGTLTEKDLTLRLDGEVDKGRVIGIALHVESNKQLYFIASPQAGQLVLDLIGAGADGKIDLKNKTTLLFTPDAKPGDAKPAKPNPPSKTDAKKPSSDRVYRHPLGFTFEHPVGWKVEKAEFLKVLLVPKDKDENEAIVVSSDPLSVPGTARADDPRWAQRLETEVAEIFPSLKRVGRVETVQTGCGTGAVMVWEGATPDGIRAQLRLYTVIEKGEMHTLFAIGPKDRIESRDKPLREVFASFAPDKSANSAKRDDTPLAKEWKQRLNGMKVTYLSSDGSDAGGYTARWDLYLNADGSFTYRDSSTVSADVGGVSGFSGGRSSSAGKWRILTGGSQAFLELRFDDGRTRRSMLSLEGGKTYVDGDRVFVTKP